MSSNKYEGEIQDITILPGRSMRKGEPLNDEEKSTLRSEFWGWVVVVVGPNSDFRIARPGALRDASVTAQTFGPTGDTMLNPIDCAERLAM